MRAVWKNEVLGDVNGDFEPIYDIEVNGERVITGAKMNLKNPITTQGTQHNADNMNNMFDIDNMDSMKGNKRETIFNADGSITEEIRDKTTNILNAKRITTFPGSNIVETTIVYTDDGKNILRNTAITTSFSGADKIIEEVN